MAARKPAFPSIFALFWQVYPERNGRRLGKAESETLFNKMTSQDQRLCVKAAANYAKDPRVQGGYVRDPIRFLKKDWWRDWLVEGREQCKYKTAAVPCEDMAELGFAYCRPHLIKRVSHLQTMTKHGITFPKGYTPPTTEEIEYVRDIANGHETSTRQPDAGAESRAGGGFSRAHLSAPAFGGNQEGDSRAAHESHQGCEGDHLQAGRADAQWTGNETGDLFAGNGLGS